MIYFLVSDTDVIFLLLSSYLAISSKKVSSAVFDDGMRLCYSDTHFFFFFEN